MRVMILKRMATRINSGISKGWGDFNRNQQGAPATKWGGTEKAFHHVTPKHPVMILGLATQNCGSRIARFTESQSWNRQKFLSEKRNKESNRSVQ